MSDTHSPLKGISSHDAQKQDAQESGLSDGSTDFAWVTNHLLTRWRVISRQDDYRRFCDSYSPRYFIYPNEDDQALFDWAIADHESQTESAALQKKYGIDQLWHYRTEFGDDIINSCLFKNDFSVEPVYFDSGNKDVPPLEAGITPLGEKEVLQLQLAKSGWITVRIRITPEVTQKQWVGELKDIIAEARLEAGITPLRKKEVSPPTAQDFEIYDLYKSGERKSQIAASIWLQPTDADNEYKRLAKLFKNKGVSDWEDRAWQEAYKAKIDTNLIQKVNDAIERVEKAMSRYTNI